MLARKPNRLKGYDYSSPGAYFVTICVHRRFDDKNIFGEIVNCEMIKNKWGNIAANQWEWLEKQYHHIVLDEWVIMPDHVHGIVRILEARHNGVSVSPDDIIGTGRDLSLRDIRDIPEKPEIPGTAKRKPLDQIIGAYKTTSSKMIHQSEFPDFQWQRSYHDHIIRDSKSLFRIRQYIRNNPMKWGQESGNDFGDIG